MMNDTGHEVREVFIAALAFDTADERARYLEEACRGRPELRARVEELLRAHEEAGTYLDSTKLDPDPIREGPGTVIGHYKLLEEIGEGAFGRVFMAQQVQPVRRKVALKIVKPGMDTREVIARFEAERQALALMDHPNIAKVFDAGTTETGRPYFVMELVPGIPITEYCDRRQLSMPQRLRLFMQVCQAAHHAHQKAVIHRDLKPTNILVTEIDGEPVPKVIDFGIAKALGQQLTEKTLFTAFQKVIGTPAYMSPEQTALSGVDVDTRSDIYSLGVLLYELLTGATPIDAATLREAGLDEVRRMIRETEPPKPSTRLRTLGNELAEVALHRHVEPSALTRMVHGDLDWIVMKALEKDRVRRYETASDLLEDLRRHLDHEPVLAGPPGVLYRARKFVRRHRAGVTLTVAVTAALVLGLVAALIGFVEVRRQRDRAVTAERQSAQQRDRALAAELMAREEAAVSEAVSGFLLEDLLDQASPYYQPDRDIKLLTLVDRAAEKVGDRFAGKPRVEMRIRLRLALVYEALEDFKGARKQLDRAKEISEALALLVDDEYRMELEIREADLLVKEGRPEEARSMATSIVADRQRVLGPKHPRTLDAQFSLAYAYSSGGKLQEALTIYEELLPLLKQVRGPEHFLTISARNNLATIYSGLGKEHEARRIYEELLAVQEPVHGPEHALTLMIRYNLGNCSQNLGELDEARRTYEALLPVQERVMSPEHSETLRTRQQLAAVYTELGRHDEALALYEDLLSVLQQLKGPEHAETLKNIARRAAVIQRQGKLDEARKLYEQLLPVMQSVLGQEDQFTLITQINLAVCYQGLGRPEEVCRVCTELLPAMRGFPGSEHPNTLRVQDLLATAYGNMGRREASCGIYEEILPLLQRQQGADHPNTLSARHNLAFDYWKLGRLDEARRAFEELMPALERVLGPENGLTLGAMQNLASIYLELGRRDDARKVYERFLPAVARVHGPESAYTLGTRGRLANAHLSLGQIDEARKIYEQIVPVMQRVQGPEHPATLNMHANIGITYCRSDKRDEGRKMLEELLPVMRRVLGPDHPATHCVESNLVAVGQDETKRDGAPESVNK